MADRQKLTKSNFFPAVNPPDTLIQDHGSIVLLVPETDAGKVWVEDNIGRDNDFQPYWPKVVAESRYVQNIVKVMRQDGLEVS